MPAVDISKYEAMDPGTLEQARASLIEKNKKITPDEWDLDDLSAMAAIIGVMRRKVSGPPKAKEAKAPRTKAKATLDDLA